MAPRPFIIETGKQDPTYSQVPPYFQSDKQVARQARVPYADLGAGANYVHYLHYEGHAYHVGDVSANYPALGLQAPTLIGPVAPNNLTSWQTDGTTFTKYKTVFAAIDALLP